MNKTWHGRCYPPPPPPGGGGGYPIVPRHFQAVKTFFEKNRKKNLQKIVDAPEKTSYLLTMQKNTVTYQVELNHPDFYVEFQAPEGLTEDQILTRAIEEMTRNTEVWSVKIKKIGWHNEKNQLIFDHE